MKEMTSLSVIESNGNLQWLQKENPYFSKTIMCHENFTMAGKLKKMASNLRTDVKSSGDAKNLSAWSENRE